MAARTARLDLDSESAYPTGIGEHATAMDLSPKKTSLNPVSSKKQWPYSR
jgi:hypothetical protein